jgi:hypothetical protein
MAHSMAASMADNRRPDRLAPAVVCCKSVINPPTPHTLRFSYIS